MAIPRSDFIQSTLPKAVDLRNELSRLHTVIARSSAAVAKQMEEALVAQFEAISVLAGTEPDATVAATVTLRQLYPEYRDWDRVHRMATKHIAASGANAAVTDAVADQIRTLLLLNGWTFA